MRGPLADQAGTGPAPEEGSHVAARQRVAFVEAWEQQAVEAERLEIARVPLAAMRLPGVAAEPGDVRHAPRAEDEMASPTVSIIVPLFAARPFVPECIASIVAAAAAA